MLSWTMHHEEHHDPWQFYGWPLCKSGSGAKRESERRSSAARSRMGKARPKNCAWSDCSIVPCSERLSSCIWVSVGGGATDLPRYSCSS